jgi:hypothetical protein
MDQHLRAWRQVQWSISQGHWREALEALPLWPVSLLLGLILSIVVIFVPHSQDIEMIEVMSALGSFSLLSYLQLLRDCLLLTGFALLVGKLKSPMMAFVIAWLILNIAAPLLAYGVAGIQGAVLVQPVISAWLGGIASPDEPAAWNRTLPWLSMGVQILVVLGWVAHVFRERVLGFARAQASTKI